MSGLSKFEQRLEQLISGAFAKAFRSAVQPVEISAALQRECDNNAQILSRDRRLVPNDFHVELSGTDLERLAPYDTAMADEMVEQLHEHAEQQGYSFPGPVAIGFESAEDLTTGRFRIRSRAQASVTGTAAPRRPPARRETAAAPRRPAPCSRSTAPGTRWRPPASWSAAAPRPTCASTTPASAGATSSSSCRPARPPAASRSATSAPRTACSSTAAAAPTPRVQDGTTVKIGNTTMTVAHRGGRRMSELTLFLIRIAYLAILWIFVLSAISVIRSDMFGARVPEAARGADPGRSRKQRPAKAAKPPSKRRGSPTHVLVTEGANTGERADLDRAPILIGRGSDAAIRLDDDYVSTRHARIAASGDEWFVEDLGSTNGTYIGSVRITAADHASPSAPRSASARRSSS